MIKRRIAFGLVALALVVVAGCGKGGVSSRKEKQLIEKAKSDLLDPEVIGIADSGFDMFQVTEGLDSPSMSAFGDIEVTGGRMFDYVKLTKDEAYWAVELDLVARNAETDEERYGIAILQYGSYVIDGVHKEADLMFSLTGTT